MPTGPSSSGARDAEAIVSAIHEAVQVMKRSLRPTFRREGLTWEQFLTLHLLSGLPNPSSSSVAKHLSVSQPTVCVSIDHLEAAGLVARRRSEKDHRAVELHVTARGRQVEVRIWRQMRRLTLKAAEKVPSEAVEATARTLHELCQNLEMAGP